MFLQARSGRAQSPVQNTAAARVWVRITGREERNILLCFWTSHPWILRAPTLAGSSQPCGVLSTIKLLGYLSQRNCRFMAPNAGKGGKLRPSCLRPCVTVTSLQSPAQVLPAIVQSFQRPGQPKSLLRNFGSLMFYCLFLQNFNGKRFA